MKNETDNTDETNLIKDSLAPSDKQQKLLRSLIIGLLKEGLTKEDYTAGLKDEIGVLSKATTSGIAYNRRAYSKAINHFITLGHERGLFENLKVFEDYDEVKKNNSDKRFRSKAQQFRDMLNENRARAGLPPLE